LPLSERERFYEFLVANKVEFIADQSGETFVATIRVVPPEPSTARLTGRSRVNQPASALSATKPSPGTAAPATRARAKQAVAVSNQPIQDAAATLKAAQSVLRRRYTRFCNLVPTLVAAPKAIRKSALTRFADEVYDARYEKDALQIAAEAEGQAMGRAPQTFPDFVYDFVSKRYGLKALLSNYCWGMISSVELMRGQNPGIEIFGKFLEETYDSIDLLFFLFARSTVQKVLDQAKGKQPEEEAVEEVDGKPVKKKESKYVPKEILMKPDQVKRAINMALPSNAKLREQVNQKLFTFMDERLVEPGKPLGLDPNFVLEIAVEAYHYSREYKQEPDKKETKQKERKDGDSFNPADELNNGEGTLPPEIRKEVRQVTQRLVSALSAKGFKEHEPQQVYEWALQVTLRRHKVGDFLELPQEVVTSMDLDEMKEVALTLKEQPQKAGPVDAFASADEVLELSHQEFEENLESNVRQLLLNAIAELASSTIASLPGSITKDEKATPIMRSILIKEFAPIADILMESIVSKDYKKWLETLKVSDAGASNSVKQRQQFEKLHDEFQNVLNTDITASVVQQVCRSVVSSDELDSMMQNRAQELAKLAQQNKLSDVASDEEPEDDEF
jgi:hypothetical protein